jgi:hypothetical protein
LSTLLLLFISCWLACTGLCHSIKHTAQEQHSHVNTQHTHRTSELRATSSIQLYIFVQSEISRRHTDTHAIANHKKDVTCIFIHYVCACTICFWRSAMLQHNSPCRYCCCQKYCYCHCNYYCCTPCRATRALPSEGDLTAIVASNQSHWLLHCSPLQLHGITAQHYNCEYKHLSCWPCAHFLAAGLALLLLLLAVSVVAMIAVVVAAVPLLLLLLPGSALIASEL